MLITPSALADINAQVKGNYDGAFSSTTVKWNTIAMEVPFGAAGMVLGWLGQTPQFREFIGERDIKSITEYGYRVNPKVFESSIGVSQSDINDGLVASKAKLAAALGEAAARHPDLLVFGALKANGVCYDGESFFSDAHPGVDGNGVATTYSNDIDGTGDAWYLMKADSVIKPLAFGVREGEGYTMSGVDNPADGTVFKTDQLLYGVRARVAVAYGPWQYALRSKADLTAANVEAAIAQMATFRGDGGAFVENDPTVIVVPPSLEAAARKVFAAERNDKGASNTLFNRVQIIVSKQAA